MSDVTAPNITPISIEAEMTSSFMDYAMSVIVSRALPDARDGLKPVHRRILFAQRGLNNTYNRPYLKCARIVRVPPPPPAPGEPQKPLPRRILFAQRGLNNTYNRPYLKCARIVGDVI